MAGLIEDYALIGDMQSAALVGRDGSVDWMCLPRFDSPACFASLLGDESHGLWRIAPAGQAEVSRRYQGETLILETTWRTAPSTPSTSRIRTGGAPSRGGMKSITRALPCAVRQVVSRISVSPW